MDEQIIERIKAIHDAIRSNDLNRIKLLFENEEDKEFYHGLNTPLIYAIRCGHNEIAKYLISNGANTEAEVLADVIGFESQENKMTPLHLAISQANNGIAEYLIDYGVNKEVLWLGKTPLIRAIFGENNAIAEYLIDNGVLINVQDNEKNTPIHLLINKRKNVLSDLANKSLDPVNKIILEASKKAQDDLLRKLIFRGLNLNLRNKDGVSVLQAIKSCKETSDIFDNTSKERVTLIFYPMIDRKDRFSRRFIEKSLAKPHKNKEVSPGSNNSVKRNRTEDQLPPSKNPRLI